MVPYTKKIYKENISTLTIDVSTPPDPPVTVGLPFTVGYGDVMDITITKTDVSSSAFLTLKGKLE